jgi:hypothetical protein
LPDVAERFTPKLVGERLPEGFREIGHFPELKNTPLIDPMQNLPGAIGSLSFRGKPRLKIA